MKPLLLLFASFFQLLNHSIFYEPIIVDDTFDMVEINTIRQSDGSIRLKQFIWWDLNRPSEIDSTMICQGWWATIMNSFGGMGSYVDVSSVVPSLSPRPGVATQRLKIVICFR